MGAVIRALIADDEAPARQKIRRHLSEYPTIEIAGEAQDGTHAVEAIQELAPDLVFLDIQMPGLDGFQVIEHVGPQAMPGVVFITAHDQHALKAFEVQALDYLVKPFSAQRFRQVIERVFLQLNRPPALLRRIWVREKRRSFLLDVSLLERAQAEGNYVRLFSAGNEYLVRATIGNLVT